MNLLFLFDEHTDAGDAEMVRAQVDIVMDADTPLHVSHDVSELLQNKLEALPHVERAFVHVDYDWHHIPVYHVLFFPV